MELDNFWKYITAAGRVHVTRAARKSTWFSLYDASWVQPKRWTSVGLVAFTSMFAASWFEHPVYHITRTYFFSAFLLFMFSCEQSNSYLQSNFSSRSIACLRIFAKFIKSLSGPQSVCVFLTCLTVICGIFNRIDRLTEFLFDRQIVLLWAMTEFLSIFVITCDIHKATWHTTDKLETVIQFKHAAYECPPTRQKIEADISLEIFWINTFCVTGFWFGDK